MSLANKQCEQVVGELRRWIADPFNESFMFQGPLSKLQQFSSAREVKPGEMLADLTSLSLWFAATGRASAEEQLCR